MPDIEERLQRLVTAAQTLLDHAEEALQHYKSGDLQAACDVVSISAYPLSDVGKEWKGVLDALGTDGIRPSQR